MIRSMHGMYFNGSCHWKSMWLCSVPFRMLQFKSYKQDVIGASQGQNATYSKPHFSHYIWQHELKGQLSIKWTTSWSIHMLVATIDDLASMLTSKHWWWSRLKCYNKGAKVDNESIIWGIKLARYRKNTFIMDAWSFLGWRWGAHMVNVAGLGDTHSPITTIRMCWHDVRQGFFIITWWEQ